MQPALVPLRGDLYLTALTQMKNHDGYVFSFFRSLTERPKLVRGALLDNTLLGIFFSEENTHGLEFHCFITKAGLKQPLVTMKCCLDLYLEHLQLSGVGKICTPILKGSRIIKALFDACGFTYQCGYGDQVWYTKLLRTT